MKAIHLMLAMMTISLVSYSQLIQLKFTAISNGIHVNIDSVRVTNLTHPGDTLLQWPDTTLILNYVGIHDIEANNLPDFDIQLRDNNPVTEQASIQLSLPSGSDVVLRVSDVTGRVLQEIKRNLPAGRHLFRYSPSVRGVNVISAICAQDSKSLKIIYLGQEKGSNALDYMGVENKPGIQKSVSSSLSFAYTLGDNLLLRGWYNGNYYTIYSAPQSNTTYTFYFNLSSPCPGIPTFVYGGQTYNTVQIGGQCWMKENLNIGSFVTSTNTGWGHSNMSDNGIIEKYCLNNNVANCTTYGGLYDWNELMQYTTQSGTQGICPVGWRIPTDQDWCSLSSYVDPTVDCGFIGEWIGTNAGGKLKETEFTHWNTPNLGATNETGFTAFGAGERVADGYFAGLKNYTVFWTSTYTATNNAFYWYLNYNYSQIWHNNLSYSENGFSVRCLKDTCIQPPTQSNAGSNQVIVGNSTSLQGNTPLYGVGTWSIIGGVGGSFIQNNNPISGFTGSVNSTYSLVWTISTDCGNSKDTVTIEFQSPASAPCPGIPTFTYGGKVYNTVQIGTQCWMKENLNIGTMIDNSVTPTDNGVIEKFCYNNDSANCNTYGGLYNWNELIAYSAQAGAQGICPAGWHVSTDQEWCTMATYIDPTVDCGYTNVMMGTSAGGKVKETGTNNWFSPNTGATNESGLTILGAGEKGSSGSFAGLKTYSVFWTSTYNGSSLPYYWYVRYDSSGIDHYNQSFMDNGWAVRCLKD